MGDLNSVVSIVRILEKPIQTIINNNAVTKCRAQFPQIRKSTIVDLVIWGNLGRDIENFYQINDHILIEGFVSLRDKKIDHLDSIVQKSKKVEITVIRAYPFF